jgi:GNAT superfamily N-acetyltransferase
MTTVSLRSARPGEEDALSDLCLRSKAHWGYDAEFVAACAPYLKVGASDIAAGHTSVAENASGAILGVCQIAPGSSGGSLELLFITPDAIGQGVGRLLFEHAKAQLREHGQTVMTILSDPYAETAYLHMGAKRIEMRASDVFPDRELPWLEVAL